MEKLVTFGKEKVQWKVKRPDGWDDQNYFFLINGTAVSTVNGTSIQSIPNTHHYLSRTDLKQ